MSTEWSLDFCLVCDRQTMGAPYCSQTCRLAELDVISEDGMSSRRSSEASTHWSETTQAQAQAAETVNARADAHNPSRILFASSSQTSLSSLKSNTSNPSNVAHRLQDELRDYASCFDQVRDLKRRMTTT